MKAFFQYKVDDFEPDYNYRFEFIFKTDRLNVMEHTILFGETND